MNARLSTLDHIFAVNGTESVQTVLHYAQGLDVERARNAFLPVARMFGISGTLVGVDERTINIDSSREMAELRVTSEAPGTEVKTCFDPLRTELNMPLARARISDLGTRGAAISLSLSHAVADGYGYFLFMAAWGARTRGVDFPNPNLDRSSLTPTTVQTSAGAPELKVGRLDSSGFAVRPSGIFHPTSKTKYEERPIVMEASESLAKASDSLSDNDALCARVWKECSESIDFRETTLVCPVDMRRYRPQLGPLYFGNAFLLASVTAVTESLRQADVRTVAQWIRAAIDAVPGRIDAALLELENLRLQHGLSGLSRISRSVNPRDALLVTNMSRIPLAAMDFGSGPPTSLEVGAMPGGLWTSVVLPGANGMKMLLTRP